MKLKIKNNKKVAYTSHFYYAFLTNINPLYLG